ncbi:ribonuclease H-like domain-containing protein [Gigaspora margarita]|uniref:Ribonuclease H-like domain-containing protein n=1 Tax=Gigaspora margarita TaxID=4874 RepID=A0A8H4AN47_GIGMA|nr:ribonuclease H-like domain-containing protein [Gigaspora margarita]
MAIAIKNISNIIDLNFKNLCIKIYNKYWKQFDILTYLLVYFLYPKYRQNLPPNDMEYNENYDTPELWWTTYEDNSFDLSDEEDESNFNDLLIAELMDLNFYDNNEPENNSFLNDQQLSENNENSNIDLEAILDKELQN